MFKSNLLAVVTATVAVLSATVAIAQEATPAPEIENFVPAKTRAAVVAETKQAMRNGQIARSDEDIHRLAQQGFGSQKSRAQVRAETIEAHRLGLVHHGEAGTPQATPEQLEQVRLAGLRAVEHSPRVAGK